MNEEEKKKQGRKKGKRLWRTERTAPSLPVQCQDRTQDWKSMVRFAPYFVEAGAVCVNVTEPAPAALNTGLVSSDRVCEEIG